MQICLVFMYRKEKQPQYLKTIYERDFIFYKYVFQNNYHCHCVKKVICIDVNMKVLNKYIHICITSLYFSFKIDLHIIFFMFPVHTFLCLVDE